MYQLTRREVPVHQRWAGDTSPLLQRIYAARGVLEPVDAELALVRLLPPDQLSGMAAALSLLAEAIRDGRKIVVVGDFDCDGATGTAVAVRGLRLLGAKHVGFRVPNRLTHGYGLSPALVEELRPLEPWLLITVDTGIACHAGVAAAKALGWRVLITDHHLPGDELPAADAIVNPNLRGDGFASKCMAGVGVVFYTLLALRRQMREAGDSAAAKADLSSLLDLVAVGTVADLVPLDYNNRLLVSAGLRRLRRGQGQAGVLALAAVAGRPLENLSATDIGFAIAPRLNAAGRLEDMALGIECLLTDDPARAADLAATLDQINRQRRDRQQDMVDQADALILSLPLEAAPAPALVLFDAGWHPGVIGLVASRVKDRLHRPVIVFAPAEPGSATLRGSARSIPGFHVRDALAALDAREPGRIERFGGHAMAAGLTLPAVELDWFRSSFAAYAQAMLSPAQLRAQLLSDGPLDADQMTREVVDEIAAAGPWGQGFEEPVFDNEFEVQDWRVLGESHLKLSLQHIGGGAPVSAIHFGGWSGLPPPSRIHAAYVLGADDYRGRNGVQLLLRQWLPIPLPEPSPAMPATTP